MFRWTATEFLQKKKNSFNSYGKSNMEKYNGKTVNFQRMDEFVCKQRTMNTSTLNVWMIYSNSLKSSLNCRIENRIGKKYYA